MNSVEPSHIVSARPVLLMTRNFGCKVTVRNKNLQMRASQPQNAFMCTLLWDSTGLYC
jgi:hypothetical protein